MSEIEILEEKLKSVKYIYQIFGNDITGSYRILSKCCHPDIAPKGEERRFADVFSRLTDLYREAKDNPTKRVLLTSPSKLKGTELKFKTENLTLKRIISDNPISQCYSFDRGYVRISKIPSNNDLILNEAKQLTILNNYSSLTHQDFVRIQSAYVPKLLGSITLNSGAKQYNCNILQSVKGSAYSVEQTILLHPKGLPLAHIWWIFRRTLLTLHYFELAGIQHHSINPRNIWIHDEAHGTVIHDFTNSSLVKGKRRYKDPQYEDIYGTDIQMLIRSMIYLATGQFNLKELPASDNIKSFFEVTLKNPNLQALDVHQKFGDLLGKKEYVELRI